MLIGMFRAFYFGIGMNIFVTRGTYLHDRVCTFTRIIVQQPCQRVLGVFIKLSNLLQRIQNYTARRIVMSVNFD